MRKRSYRFEKGNQTKSRAGGSRGLGKEGSPKSEVGIGGKIAHYTAAQRFGKENNLFRPVEFLKRGTAPVRPLGRERGGELL